MSILMDKPYLILPLFLLEELGVPLPLVLSGFFLYIGYAIAQGHLFPLVFVPANAAVALVGATGIYWAARSGVSPLLWRQTALERITRLRQWSPFASRGWSLLAVVGARFAPVPMILVSAAFGVARVPYQIYALGVVLTALLWNGIFIGGGLVAGILSAQVPAGLPPVVRYSPAVVVWGAMLVALALWRRRSARLKRSE